MHTVEDSTEKYGAIVKLYRWMVNNSLNGQNPSFEYLVWGYFDQMDICPLKSLKNFYQSPYSNDDDDKNKMRFESQRMCLYTSNKSDLDFLLNKDFQFDGTYYPLIVITEIKFNYLPHHKNSDRKLFRELLETYLKDHLVNNVHYSTFSSLGYSDTIVAFRGNSYVDIMAMVKGIRQIFLPSTLIAKKSDLLVKSTYSITGVNGVHAAYVAPEKTNLSIRVSVKSFHDIDYVKSQIKTMLGINESSFRIVFGKYDLDIISDEVSPQKYIEKCETDENSILNPRSADYRTYINYRNTRWLVPEDDPPIDDERPKNHIDNADNLTKDILILIKVIQKSEILAEPLQTELQQLFNRYSQIIQNEVSEKELSQDLHDIFYCFLSLTIYNLGISKTFLDTLKKKYLKSGVIFGNDLLSGNEIIFENKSIFDISSFELGLHIIENVIQNRVHASRMVFEMPTYNSNLLETSTNISLLYSKIVETIERDLRAIRNEQQIEATTNYFTLFDHTFDIKATSLFPALINISNQRLIAIQLNNAAFYDFKFSIPFLFHEIGHYLAYGNRSNRNFAFTQSVCTWYGQYIVGKFIEDEFMRDIFTQRLEESYYELIKGTFLKISDGLGKSLCKKLWGSLSDPERNYHFTDFKDKLLETYQSTYCIDMSELHNIFAEIQNIFSPYRDINLYQEPVKNVERFFDNIISISSYSQIDISDAQKLWAEFLPKIEKDIPGGIVDSIKKQWEKLVAIIEEQYRTKSNNIIELASEVDFASMRDISIGLHEKPGNDYFNRVLKLLSRKRVLECTKGDLSCINKNIIDIIFDYTNNEEIEGIFESYYKLYNDILADYYMVKVLHLDETDYLGLLEYFSNNGKSKIPDQNGYNFAMQVRLSALHKCGAISEISSDDFLVVNNFEPLIKMLIAEESEINELIENNAFLQNIFSEYKKYVDKMNSSINGNMFSVEINFIDAILEY